MANPIVSGYMGVCGYFPPELGGGELSAGLTWGGAVGTGTGTNWMGILGLGGACPCFCCSTNCSTGTESDGGCTGTGPVVDIPGCRSSILELGARNLFG